MEESSGGAPLVRGRARSPTVFEEFFAENYRSVTKALVLIAGDQMEAEELAEEAFARAWARWDQLREMASPAGYVYKTALNLHRSRLRRLAREVRRHPMASEPDLGEGAEARDEIRRALLSLSIGQRQALVMVEWLGYTVEESAALLGIRQSSVRSRLHRARAMLREGFGGSNE